MYLNMICRVTIGDIFFNHINSVQIEESVNQLSDSASIILPRMYQELNGKRVLDYIKPGDPVKIELGYLETGMITEFVGFVRRISSDIPIEVTCDELYKLRQNNFIKSYKSTTLKQVLTDVTLGTFIKRIECPDVELGKFQIDNASTFQVLDKIKEELGLYSKIDNDLLYVGFSWDWRPGFTSTHTYTIQENVKRNDLKYKTKDEFNVKVRVKIRDKKGQEKYVEAGSKDSDAAVTTIEYAAADTDAAKRIAEARLKKQVYDGYTGSISGFGIPVTHAGDSLTIKDKLEPSREGNYLIEKVVTSWDENDGYQRKNDLAYKI